jgi:NAD(P)-dependent dehydrogenase (short-subunit alcohol dehydrogenase family)
MTDAQRPERPLADLTARVTGGSRGIGRAIAQALGHAGAAVAITARAARDLEATAAELRTRGITVLAVPVDVTDRTGVDTIVAQTERALGPIGLLVNNARTCEAIGPVWDVDPDVWWHEVEIHLRGAFLCARAVLPGMVARRSGRIINLASAAGLVPAPFTSA